MKFMLFIIGFWLLALFYRWEHKLYVSGLKELHKKLIESDNVSSAVLAGSDWRITGQERQQIFLRRAFHVNGRNDLLRYGIPVLTLGIIMIVLQNWIWACLYAALTAVKWFLTTTTLNLSPHNARYNVTLFGLPLFGEDL